jgi:hypothetical protein
MLETYIRPVKTNGNTSNQWDVASAYNRLPEVIQGIVFKDGIKQLQTAA